MGPWARSFAAAVVGSPALFLIRPPEYLAERYCLIPFVFFLLLVSAVLVAIGGLIVLRVHHAVRSGEEKRSLEIHVMSTPVSLPMPPTITSLPAPP